MPTKNHHVVVGYEDIYWYTYCRIQVQQYATCVEKVKNVCLRFCEISEFTAKTDDNGNAMLQSFLSKLFKKETG